MLVNTAGALNLGAVARVMKNFALSRLYLVAPRCSPEDEQAQRMAVHAVDILEQAVIVEDLRTALSGCERVLGTTGRPRSVSDPFLVPPSGAEWLLTSTSDSEVACVFGPEDRGLSNQELAMCHRFVQIPTADAYTSLNLAQAVAVCAYELFMYGGSAPAPVQPVQPTSDELEGFYEHLEKTLLHIGYLQDHTAARKLEKFRRLLNRAQPSAEEVALLRGILRQVNWASHMQQVD